MYPVNSFENLVCGDHVSPSSSYSRIGQTYVVCKVLNDSLHTSYCSYVAHPTIYCTANDILLMLASGNRSGLILTRSFSPSMLLEGFIFQNKFLYLYHLEDYLCISERE